MPDILWKWVIIGNSGVGKTSLLQRLCNDEFNNTFISTIGIDFKIKKMEVAGKNITVQIWDTAGQERFGTITKSCYRGSVGVILVYGINDRNTYEDVNKWLNDIKLHTGERVARILLGNKCDLQASRAVTSEEGQALADRNEIPFMETSAKSGKNVQEAFVALAKQILGEPNPMVAISPSPTSSTSKSLSSKKSRSTVVVESSSPSPPALNGSTTSSYFSFFKGKESGSSRVDSNEDDHDVSPTLESTHSQGNGRIHGNGIRDSSNALQVATTTPSSYDPPESTSFKLSDNDASITTASIISDHDYASANSNSSNMKKSRCC